MRKTTAAFAAAGVLLLSGPFARAAATSPKPAAHVCGAPLPAGPLQEPPQIEMAGLPKDDLGSPELILRVAHDGPRFCYRYTYDGRSENVAPVLRVHRGDRFDLRLVNELSGPAPGVAMTARALQPCAPAAMPEVAVRPIDGYMHHIAYTRLMPPMKDTDVNIHFHGFQGAPAEENIFLSTLSTKAHACEYHIAIPRTQPVGTYYYHPHAHGMAGDEVAGGLSGMWIVEPDRPMLPRADEHEIVFQYEVPFVSDTAPIVKDGALYESAALHSVAAAQQAPVAFDPFDPPPWPSSIPLRNQTVSLHAPLCGDRHGGAIVADGVRAPAELTLPANQPQLLRIINSMSDSIQNLQLRDAHGNVRPLEIVGRDGSPMSGDDAHPLARYERANEATLVPPQRLDVLLTLAPGDELALVNVPHCAGPFDELQIHRTLLVLRAGAAPATTASITTSAIAPSQRAGAALVRFVGAHRSDVRRRAFTYTEYGLPTADGKSNDANYMLTETDGANFHERPFWPMYAAGATAPMPDVVAKRGTIEEWYLYNASLETHSFHIHQMDFVALDGAGAPATLDTVAIPPGEPMRNPRSSDYPLVKPTLTRVLLDFRNVPRGTFVFHCHMLFHEDHGMMGVIRVE